MSTPVKRDHPYRSLADNVKRRIKLITNEIAPTPETIQRMKNIKEILGKAANEISNILVEHGDAGKIVQGMDALKSAQNILVESLFLGQDDSETTKQ